MVNDEVCTAYMSRLTFLPPRFPMIQMRKCWGGVEWWDAATELIE